MIDDHHPIDNRGLLSLLIPSAPPKDDPRWYPTEAEPGSPEKMAMITERLKNGLPMWHPQDRGTRDLRWFMEE